MELDESRIREIAGRAASRSELWIDLLSAAGAEDVAEIGVYRGDFAAEVLAACSAVRSYYMIDPWRHLADWNKPANAEDATFEQFFAETMQRTDFALDKRIVLRGKTTEVIGEIPDESLDFVYVDGDHTLRGIAIDLIRAYPKLRIGGWLGGDDFTTSIWTHHTRFEPTLVFPYAVYFAEAVGARILALPQSQFLIRKTVSSGEFEFVDLTGRYGELALHDQLRPASVLGVRAAEVLSPARRLKKLRAKVARALPRSRR